MARPNPMEDMTPEQKFEVHGLGPLTAALDEFEHAYLLRALAATGGCRARAANLLGISRKTLWVKLRRHRDRAMQTAPSVVVATPPQAVRP